MHPAFDARAVDVPTDVRTADDLFEYVYPVFAKFNVSRDEMIAFIDEHRDRFGVEAICRTLSATACGFITSRAYRAAKTRPTSARALRDAILIEELRRIHAENYSVYGVRKMHHAMVRAGWQIGRDQVARLMRAAGSWGGPLRPGSASDGH